MQNQESVIIIDRFFEAIEMLIRQKVIRGKKTFCDVANINRRNFRQLELNHSRDIFQVEWLSVLVEKYKMSAQWLLTGKGNMFAKNEQGNP